MWGFDPATQSGGHIAPHRSSSLTSQERRESHRDDGYAPARTSSSEKPNITAVISTALTVRPQDTSVAPVDSGIDHILSAALEETQQRCIYCEETITACTEVQNWSQHRATELAAALENQVKENERLSYELQSARRAIDALQETAAVNNRLLYLFDKAGGTVSNGAGDPCGILRKTSVGFQEFCPGCFEKRENESRERIQSEQLVALHVITCWWGSTSTAVRIHADKSRDTQIQMLWQEDYHSHQRELMCLQQELNQMKLTLQEAQRQTERWRQKHKELKISGREYVEELNKCHEIAINRLRQRTSSRNSNLAVVEWAFDKLLQCRKDSVNATACLMNTRKATLLCRQQFNTLRTATVKGCELLLSECRAAVSTFGPLVTSARSANIHLHNLKDSKENKHETPATEELGLTTVSNPVILERKKKMLPGHHITAQRRPSPSPLVCRQRSKERTAPRLSTSGARIVQNAASLSFHVSHSSLRTTTITELVSANIATPPAMGPWAVVPQVNPALVSRRSTNRRRSQTQDVPTRPPRTDYLPPDISRKLHL